jgi:uncharacterized protein YciI
MTSAFQLFVLSLSFIGFGSTSVAGEVERDYFVFLTTGKTTQGVATEEIQKKQAAHLENFGRLAKLGSLTAAGPCSDPEKITRGIVVINADSIADAEAMFGPDPYVSEGFMKAELNGYQTVAGKLTLVTEVTSMEQSVLVIVTQGAKWPTEQSKVKSVEEQLSKLAKDQYETKKVGFAGLFNAKSNNTSKRVAVMLFRGKELEPVKAILESHPLVRDGVVQFKAFPQYMAKGALPPVEEH